MKINTGEFSSVLSNSFGQETIFYIQGRTWMPHYPFHCHLSWHVCWGTACMVFRKGKMYICRFFWEFPSSCCAFLCGLCACLSQWSFPDTPRKKSDVCHVLLIDESQDQLPLQKILHIRCKGSPLCFNACIRLIQISWLPNFYSQISPIITFQFNWFLNFHSQYNLRSTRSNELKLC